MPDSLDLAGMLCAVVPVVRGEGFAATRRRVVDELVALAGGRTVGRLGRAASGRFPRLSAVARALDDLSKPPAGLRRIQPIRIGGRAPEMIDLPARAKGPTGSPGLAAPVPS